ncbi:hypothetical protein B0H10DRAFT_2214224 [Mycena sp. CBHHK59/15]|nr:hypothetical protein B0H10DRAFT_2214224 [Mycena sp. CBHHK59/15]
MRRRILSALDLEKISITVLLLGAGTLGCHVARTIMGWGVRDITLVDSDKVSFSKPVRQPLFEFEDCVDGGKPKAECAAARMKEIFSGIKLEELIEAHDAVFLLVDSRESQWLPTVICAAKGKSLTERTLDEMCTVTRPGLASIAASTAVELLALHATALPPNSDPAALHGAVVGAAYGRFTGCSEADLKGYETQGFDMILQALNDDKFLQKLTGLDQLHGGGKR